MKLSRNIATSLNRVILCLLVALLLSGEVSQATERVQRRFDSTTGLAVSTIFSLAQDAEGFIWIGTAGGVVRYDGSQMRPWAKGIINRDVFTLATSPKGEVVVAEGSGTLYVITGDGVTPVAGPGNKPFPEVLRAEFDEGGRLWVITANDELHFRDEQKLWHTVDGRRDLSGEVPNRIRRASDDRVYVVTNKGVWQTRAGESPRKVAEVRGAMDVVAHPDGSLFVLAWSRIPQGTGVFEVRDGHAKMRVAITHRPIELARRGSVIWASTSHTLISLRGSESPDVIGPEHDLPGGGPLLVDHEGSLWLGTFAGLLQYPEPETLIWNQKDGMSSAHTRFLEKTEEGIWVVIWGPFARLTRDGSGWRVYDEKISSHLCVNNEGVLFAGETDGLLVRRTGRFVRHSPLPGDVGFRTCAHARDGTFLFATARGIFRANFGQQPEFVSSPLGDDGKPASVFRIFEDGQKRLWAGMSDGRICRSSVAAVLTGQPGLWSCQLIPGSPDIFDIIDLPSGNVWMTTNRAGVWRLRDDWWEPIPGSRNLASQSLFGLAASPAGGVWVVGHGTAMRVVEDTESPEGWKVEEVLSPWHGLAASDAGDLIDEPDGSLWLTTSVGVVRIPPEARRAAAVPPRVRLVDVVINGRSTNSEVKPERLSYGSQVELHFAALSYRDRGRLRYQYRLKSDAAWIDSNDSAPVLRFVDLRAGDYQAEVRASLDGVNWTTTPARLSFQVLNPWYLRPITLLLFALVGAAVLYAIYRARVRAMMRLERQRRQIARDLHDEMGSGLGSIGILSGLAAQKNLEGIDHQELARKISETAGELGTTLTEIVWALKPGTSTLQALAYHLAERGGRLFPGNAPNFTTHFPATWPKIELSLAVRRNVLLIASEALHNTARHSEAKEVTLGLEPAAGNRWKLWLSDDGRGLSDGHESHGSGMGLQNMRRRAQEIGAGFTLSTNNGKGTSLSLVFDPNADDRRLE